MRAMGQRPRNWDDALVALLNLLSGSVLIYAAVTRGALGFALLSRDS